MKAIVKITNIRVITVTLLIASPACAMQSLTYLVRPAISRAGMPIRSMSTGYRHIPQSPGYARFEQQVQDRQQEAASIRQLETRRQLWEDMWRKHASYWSQRAVDFEQKYKKAVAYKGLKYIGAFIGGAVAYNWATSEKTVKRKVAKELSCLEENSAVMYRQKVNKLQNALQLTEADTTLSAEFRNDRIERLKRDIPFYESLARNCELAVYVHNLPPTTV